MSRSNTEKLLHTHLEDICNAVYETDSLTLVNSALSWADYFDKFKWYEPSADFMRMTNNIAWGNNIDEICFINEEGIIVASNIHEYLGYEMTSAEQSAEFLKLLTDPDTKTYVQKLREQGYDHQKKFRYVGAVMPHHAGFIELGITEDNYRKQICELLKNSTRYRRIGDNGSIFILDEDFQLISAPRSCSATSADSIGVTRQMLEQQKPSEIFECEIMGVNSYAMYNSEQGCIVLAAQPVSEAMLTRDTAVSLSSITVSVIFLILFVTIWLLIRKLVVKNIDRVNGSLSKITNGNLEEIVEVRDTTEFDSLSTDINMTVHRLKEYIHEAETRMDADLALAKAIQLAALPTTFPKRKDFDLYASMLTAKEVGGDFYDFYFSSPETLTITIADVAGKGIPAAMFMMGSKTTLKNQISTGMKLDEACSVANTTLSNNNDTCTFLTAWIGQINLTTGLMTFVNCGHNRPVIRRNSGRYEFAECEADLPMAVLDKNQYKCQTIQLKAGDEILLYTDGVTEATDPNKKLFGDDQLIEVLNKMTIEQASSTESICHFLLNRVQTFANGADQSDDITMLCFRYLG